MNAYLKNNFEVKSELLIDCRFNPSEKILVFSKFALSRRWEVWMTNNKTLQRSRSSQRGFVVVFEPLGKIFTISIIEQYHIIEFVHNNIIYNTDTTDSTSWRERETSSLLY